MSQRGKLIVAKLDRLSRNAGFLVALRDSWLPLIVCDMPGANELMAGIMAVIAEAAGKMISQRTPQKELRPALQTLAGNLIPDFSETYFQSG